MFLRLTARHKCAPNSSKATSSDFSVTLIGAIMLKSWQMHVLYGAGAALIVLRLMARGGLGDYGQELFAQITVD